MGFAERISAPVNSLAAYQIAMECLPREAMWGRALEARCGGMDPALVHKIVAMVRSELQTRLGDLVYGATVPSQVPTLSAIIENPQLAEAASVAFEFILHHFPSSELLWIALPCRRDGSDVLGVLEALDDWRRELRILQGDAAAVSSHALESSVRKEARVFLDPVKVGRP